MRKELNGRSLLGANRFQLLSTFRTDTPENDDVKLDQYSDS